MLEVPEEMKDFMLIFEATKYDEACKHHFATVFMASKLCVCMKPDEATYTRQLAYAHISLGLFGVVVILMCLVVSSTMITKSSTAVLVSILLLYKLLRLAAAGLLASFTLVSRRDFAQKVSNAMWLLGTWGVQYTLLDMAMEQVLAVFRPRLAHVHATPHRTLKRTAVVLVLGLLVCGNAMAQAVVKTEGKPTKDIRSSPTCEQEQFYFGYWVWYQRFLVAVIWLGPLLALTIIFLVLLVNILHRRIRSNTNIHSYYNTRDILQQQTCMLVLVGVYLSLNLPFCYQLTQLMLWNAYVQHINIMELLVLVAIVLSPFSLLFWNRFRAEGVKSFMCKSLFRQTSQLSNTRSMPSIIATGW